MKKRFFAILTVIFIAVSQLIPASAEEKFKIDDESLVTFIVEVSGDAVLASDEAEETGTDYNKTYEGKKIEAQNLKIQASVLSEISKRTNNNEKKGYTYTSLFNGFSIQGKKSDLEAIKDIPGVKNVYISQKHKMEFFVSNASEMTNSTPSQTSSLTPNGYTGKGQLIAVIDSEFDTEHNFFKGAVESPKYKEADMSEVLSSDKMSASFSAGQAWKNEKIPFAYDYGEGDYSTYSEKNKHGTHVAGIAGGNNGTLPDGTSFTGVAKDAQLALMKITDANGIFSDEAFFAALEDAATLGACAVNMSFGTKYLSSANYEGYSTIMDNAKNAGMFLCVASGNSGNQFETELTLPENIDYSTSGIPAEVSSATSVGSAINTMTWSENTQVLVGKGGEMAPSSSFGVSEGLELKPEITAPGRNIYSSVADNKYEILGGTSMAAPHIAGIVALMNEFYDAKLSSSEEEKLLIPTGKERALEIENRMMSTAEPCTYKPNAATSIPYSPRVQGAGLVNTVASIKTDVYLKGDNGKTKLSLKDKLLDEQNSFNITFTAENKGKTDVVFDKNSVKILGDKTAVSDGKTVVTVYPKEFTATSTLSESITVPANGSVKISFKVTIDATELASQGEIFKNGFFIDGFVRLSKEDESVPAVGIPFTGFCGDWTDATVFDKTMYDEGGSDLYVENKPNFQGTKLYSSLGDGYGTYLGLKYTQNEQTGEVTYSYDKERIAFSPNGDGLLDTLGIFIQTRRSVSGMTYTIKDKNGNTAVAPTVYEENYNKYYTYQHEIENVSSLSEGEYTLNATTKFNYDGASEETLSIPVTVDKTMPTFKSIDLKNNILTVTAYDNHYIREFSVYYIGANGNYDYLTQYKPSEAKGGEAVASFDLTGVDLEGAIVEVADSALNCNNFSLEGLDGKVQVSMGAVYGTARYTEVGFEFHNTTSETINGELIVAFYDNNNQLIGVKTEPAKVLSGFSNYTLSMLADTRQATYIKVMFWDNTKNITPLDTAKRFKIFRQ